MSDWCKEHAEGQAMTEDELKVIEKRAKVATPGPWKWLGGCIVSDTGHRHAVIAGSDDGSLVQSDDRGFMVDMDETFHDVQFIAASREDVPALIAEVRRLREELVQQRRAAASIATAFGHG